MQQNYVIITPAFNEEAYIAKTIEGVLAQTIQPQLWVIVDDGSTDGTANIIKNYASRHSFIQYHRRIRQTHQSYYASNVYAIEEGYKIINDIDYEFLAILDADISLPPDYYAIILTRMQKDKKLGIASGIYVVQNENRLEKVLNDRRSCPKNIMVFRRACFDEIGGFVPMKFCGEDTCACYMARMKDWKTWSFPDLKVIHNKPVGTGHTKNILKIRFKQGIGEYFLATHPLFMLIKSFRRCIKEPPYLIGGLARMAGFFYASFMGQKRQISDELVRFIRKEQLRRVFHGNRVPVKYEVKAKI